MSSQGPNNPSSAANDAVSGTIAWSNPTNVFSSDNSRATSTLVGGQDTQLLSVKGFGFSIPDGSTIDGVEVLVERSASVASRIVDETLILQYVDGGTPVTTSDNKADVSTFWGTTDATITYGAPTDTWGGTTFTPSQINDSEFGIYFQAFASGGNAQARVDHVRVTVYYTAGGGGSVFQTYYYRHLSGGNSF